MKHLSKKFFAFVLIPFWLVQVINASGQPLQGEIHFIVSMENPGHHLYHVVMQCRGLQKDSLDFSMPVWSPGYYRIMDYSQNVLKFRATGEKGKSLEWKKNDKNTWRVMAESADSLTVEYDVYAFTVSVADPFLDEGRGFISPTGIFLYIDGMIRHPVTVSIHPYSGFKSLSSGLEPIKDTPNTFYAPDFDVLYDCPVLLGNQEIVNFMVQGIPHTIAIEDPGDIDLKRLVRDLATIVETASSVIGELPYRNYTFLMMKQGMGGLEHASSMAVYYDPEGLTDEKKYIGFLGFLAHEYFHLYNVKTIRPFSLGPFDYEKENDTRLLWISEGITVYYETLILNRAGFLSRNECLEEFSRTIRKSENSPGHLFQSAEESGTDAWMQFFNFLDPAKNNTTISYYDKGCALGLLLDITIRHETQGKKSLDDVMRQLYAEFYKSRNRGFTELEFRRTCETIAGRPLDEIFSYASTVAAIDYTRYFDYAGLEIDTAWHEMPGITIGIRTQEEGSKLLVSDVTWNSPGWKAGLSPGDEIVDINQMPVRQDLWNEVISSVNPGETIKLMVHRRNRTEKIELVPEKREVRTFAVTPMPYPSLIQQEILNGWLSENK